MAPLRLYVETSVWSHYFADDAPQWREETRRFLAACREPSKQLTIHISQTVIDELERASPDEAKAFLELVESHDPVMLEALPPIQELADAYARFGAIPPRKTADAFHAAAATVHQMDALVSWNYRHMVNYDRRQKINAVNHQMGYNKRIEIVTPPEVNPDAGEPSTD